MKQEDKEPIDNILYAAACGIKNTKIMTQEDKQLLLKDLSARLPYDVKCKVNFDDGTSDVMKLSQFPDGLGIWGFYKEGCCGRTDNFKPYLRPMSSMTKEEKEEIRQQFCYEWEESVIELMYYSIKIEDTDCFIDWFLKHHFDFRGLIEKGLALEAPDNMYKTE